VCHLIVASYIQIPGTGIEIYDAMFSLYNASKDLWFRSLLGGEKKKHLGEFVKNLHYHEADKLLSTPAVQKRLWALGSSLKTPSDRVNIIFIFFLSKTLKKIIFLSKRCKGSQMDDLFLSQVSKLRTKIKVNLCTWTRDPSSKKHKKFFLPFNPCQVTIR